jgi:RNA polymerase sigma factor (sigma-70 family)
MWDGEWAERVRVLTPVLLRRLRSSRLSEADAQDAAQAAWLALFLRPGAVRDRDRLAGWLGTTARRQAARAIARRAREPLLPEPPPVPSPETGVLMAERDRALWQAVDALPERHRRLLHLLAHRPELSAREIAEELGISPGSIATLKRRCCARVRRHLQAEGFHAA